MNTKQFNWIVEKRCEAIKETLVKKGAEYSQRDERLHNFKVAPGFTGLSPERSLWGMLAKHLVSVKDIIDNCDDKDYIPSQELINEKLGDVQCYMVLLEALLTERSVEQKLPF